MSQAYLAIHVGLKQAQLWLFLLVDFLLAPAWQNNLQRIGETVLKHAQLVQVWRIREDQR
jgi:hypothetical protein